MSLQSRTPRPSGAASFEEEEKTRAKKGTGKKSSEAGAIRAFSAAAALKGRLAKPGYVKACHSKLPEAVVKIIVPKDGKPLSGKQILELLKYVARTDADQIDTQKVNDAGHMAAPVVEDEEGQRHEGLPHIKKLYEEWAKDFDTETKNGKDPRHIMHLTLSAKAENTPHNLQNIMEAARETARLQFPGYRYAIGLHQDGNKPHVHLVIACNPKDESLKKLRVGPSDLMQMRTVFARELTTRGLTHVATLRKDRPHIQEKIRNGEERLKPERRYWFVAKDERLLNGLKEIEALHAEYHKLQVANSNAAGIKAVQENIRVKAEKLEDSARQRMKQGSKNRAALFGATRKIKRDVGLETLSKERPARRSSQPTMAERKAALEAKINERQAKGLPTDQEKGKLARIIAAEAAKNGPASGMVQPWELAQIRKAIADGEQALKAADLTPEARALAERALNFHKAAVAKATAPLSDTKAPAPHAIAPQVAPLAPEAPRLSVEQPRPILAPQKAPEPPKRTPAPSKGYRR